MKSKLIVIVAFQNTFSLDIMGPSDVFTAANNITHFKNDATKCSYNVKVVSATEDLSFIIIKLKFKQDSKIQ